jgi:S-methylmethionine-dependent homocysteine/selenocysteine methylase
VSSLNALLTRLDAGRPLVFGGDPTASFLARGAQLEGAAPLGRALREAPNEVAEHYQQEIAAGVDVIAALTAETMPRALGQIGMAFRSAALTGAAIDMALEAAEAAPRPVAVAGLLGARWIAPVHPERITEEYAMHATRLSTSGCELIVARGFSPEAFRAGAHLSRLARMAAITSACTTHLPTWALLETMDGERLVDGDTVEEGVRAALEACAQALLLEAPTEAAAQSALENAKRAGASRVGILLAASPHSQHGVPEPHDIHDLRGLAGGLGAEPGMPGKHPSSAEAWVASCKRLVDAGACVIGGGAGTTSWHVAALARALKGPGRSGSERPPLWPQAL